MKKEKAEPLGIPDAQGERALVTGARSGGRAGGIEKSLLRRTLEMLGNPPLRVVLPTGETVCTSQQHPVAGLLIRDRAALFKLLSHPNLRFGDLYSAGRVEVEGDLIEFLELIDRAMSSASKHVGFLKRQAARRLNRPRSNTLSGSRDHIHHHYDIGNAFYTLWLDHEMQYTCAYYPMPDCTLEQAQRAKMDHVCRKLQLKPGQSVVEAGCGWGGLARHMAKHYGVTVRAYNISHEQILYARERATAEGLSDNVEYVEDDYRTIRGQYDAFVSVGMLEHVGVSHYRTLGEVIAGALKPSGRGLVHTIGRNKAEPMNAWIERRIFPGAYPPTLREMMDIFEPQEFSILDVENLRLHYARTLRHWLERFNASADQVSAMFDEAFVRAWRLYLSGSIAAFTSGSLQLFQVVFAHRTDNDVPWTRAHLYGA